MKKVLITGGNKGIGLEITRMFVEAGEYVVYVLARDFKDFPFKQDTTVHEIEFDLSKTEKLSEIREQVEDMDILINNAGIMQTYAFNEYPEDQRDFILNVNLLSPVELMNICSTGMLKKGSGRIVNVTSVAGYVAHPDVWYGITKAGLINATKGYAKQLGQDGIVVNAVAPGPVDTEMLHKFIPEDRVEAFKQAAVDKRIAKPMEIAKTIFWLATESPEHINGFCIDVNGGAYLR